MKVAINLNCSSLFYNTPSELEKMTFIEYLRKSDLTEKLIQYVLLCIAMTDGCVPALEVRNSVCYYFEGNISIFRVYWLLSCF